MDKSLEDRVRKQNWVERNPRSFPLVMFLLALILVVIGAIAAEVAERNALKQTLALQVAEFRQSIMRQETAYGAILQVGALFLSSVDVDRAEFDRFVRSVSLSIDPEDARGVGWAEVERDPVTSTIKAVRIRYIAPGNDANRRAINFNMYGERKRRNAIDRAIRSDQPTTTAPVVLIQDVMEKRKRGFLLYQPVNGSDALPKGFVYVAFQGETFLRAQLNALPYQPAYAALYDVENGKLGLLAEVGNRDSRLFSQTTLLNFGSRQWKLVIGRAPPQMLSKTALWLFCSGFIIALLLFFISRMIVEAAMRDRAAYEWQTKQLQIRQTLNRELNHRVKNTLANVLSILALTRHRATDLDDFADSLAGRICALSATHGLLTQTEWANAGIKEVFEAELAPFLVGDDPVIRLSGPNLNLTPSTALSLGLAVHELATNAAKYGALKTTGGYISIDWKLANDTKVTIHWTEHGGPIVSPPAARGFGMELLENVVSHELSEKVLIEFRPQGLYCRLTVPIQSGGQLEN
ncbi:MAG: CHASE domain-containing protein [Sphingorhabdus sp.]